MIIVLVWVYCFFTLIGIRVAGSDYKEDNVS